MNWYLLALFVYLGTVGALWLIALATGARQVLVTILLWPVLAGLIFAGVTFTAFALSLERREARR